MSENKDAPKSEALPVLIVDDEQVILRATDKLLEHAGISPRLLCDDSREVLKILGEQEIGVILLDLSMPHLSGQDLLKILKEEYPDVPVIIITGEKELNVAISCMKLGAFDYLVKPTEHMRLSSAINHALELRNVRREYDSFRNRTFSQKIENAGVFKHIVTQDPAMLGIFQYIETISGTDKPVLITGETGTGKDLIARTIHKLSNRTGPYLAVNVSGFDDTLFSDTLFGHVRGAYTGAGTVRQGMVEKASEGTLFLDEIGDLSLTSQIKLLRFFEDKMYYPLGADTPLRSTARIITATNCDLMQMQKDSEFRKDLYFRLSTHQIHLPPLRERKDDIPLLLDHFMEIAAQQLNKKVPTYPKELITLLRNYQFPGNIRELEAMVFDTVSRHQSKMLSMNVFKSHIGRNTESFDLSSEAKTESDSLFNLNENFPSLAEATEFLVNEAMRRADSNKSEASRLLGITRSGLSKMLKRREESQ